jgi:large-conductance mechanosensitive channel
MTDKKPTAAKHETKVIEHADGSVHITQPKGKAHRNVTILFDEPQDAVRDGVGGFVQFLREKAVVGLAVGFIIGQQAQGLIKQLVDSFITPLLNIVVGSSLQTRQFMLGAEPIAWGKFAYIFINFAFVIIAIYIVIKLFKLDKLDLPKDKAKDDKKK